MDVYHLNSFFFFSLIRRKYVFWDPLINHLSRRISNTLSIDLGIFWSPVCHGDLSRCAPIFDINWFSLLEELWFKVLMVHLPWGQWSPIVTYNLRPSTPRIFFFPWIYAWLMILECDFGVLARNQWSFALKSIIWLKKLMILQGDTDYLA